MREEKRKRRGIRAEWVFFIRSRLFENEERKQTNGAKQSIGIRWSNDQANHTGVL